MHKISRPEPGFEHGRLVRHLRRRGGNLAPVALSHRQFCFPRSHFLPRNEESRCNGGKCAVQALPVDCKWSLGGVRRCKPHPLSIVLILLTDTRILRGTSVMWRALLLFSPPRLAEDYCYDQNTAANLHLLTRTHTHWRTGVKRQPLGLLSHQPINQLPCSDQCETMNHRCLFI